MSFWPVRCLLIGTLTATLLTAQTAPPAGPAVNSIPALNAVLATGVQQHFAPGVVAVVVNQEKVLYTGVAGQLNARAHRPMRPDAIFRIASMTKPFTAVAIMMLQEEGKLSVEDPVSKYLPAYGDVEVLDAFDENTGVFTSRKPEKELLLRHLLSNTSGFGYAFSSPTLKIMRDKTHKATEQLPLLHEPGAQWTYGMSAKLLGQVVEEVSGMSLDQFFNTRIFQPLDLKDTFYLVPAAKLSRVATMNHRNQVGTLVEKRNPPRLGSRAAGDGGLFSTAGDYARFLQMLLNNGKAGNATLLSEESVRAMIQNQIGDIFVQTQETTDPAVSLPFPFGAGRDKFGFAFQLAAANSDSDFRSAGSYSWAGSNNTHFWVDPARQIAVVVMMQLTPFYDEGAMKLLENFERAVGRNLD
jgi:CubicO group peptidase (beta-lactamase class C family)